MPPQAVVMPPLHHGDAWRYSVTQRVIRLNDLASTPDKPGKLPVSPATIWRWVREGHFPKPFKIGPATTVWDADQVDAFLAQQAGGASK